MSGTASRRARPGSRRDARTSGHARIDQADRPWLAALLLVGAVTLAGFALNAHQLTNGQGGVPLDDAWIHFQFARNLARGDGFAFNAGQPTAGSTAPLWTALLAGAYALGGPFPLTGQLLSAASYLGTLVAGYVLARQLTGQRWLAWLAAAVTALNGRFVWAGLSALETPLFAALSLLAVSSHLRQRPTERYCLHTGALFGLAALLRPEGLLLFALSVADFVLSVSPRESKGEPWAASRVVRLASRVLPALGAFAALVLPYALFSLRTAGHLLPNTFSAKTVFDFRPDFAFLSLASRYLILDNPLLLPFFVLGLGLALHPARILTAWALGLPLVYAFLHATLYQHGRYLIPLIPCNAVIAVIGLQGGSRLTRRWQWRWGHAQATLIGLVTALAVAGTTWRLPTMGRLFAQDVDNINQMHVAIGHWVVEHTPADALLALNDIGAITYISEREIVDLAGLVTPRVTPILRAGDTTTQLTAFMAEQGVDYVIIFPNWFPGLAEQKDLLQPIHRVSLERRTITGGKTMVVYRTNWSP